MSKTKFSLDVRKLRAKSRRCRGVFFEHGAPAESRVAFSAMAAAGAYKFTRDSMGNRVAVLPINRRS